MRVRPVGTDALLIECADVQAWRAELWRRREAGQLSAVDIVPGARTVLLSGVPEPERVAAELTRWSPGPALPEDGPEVEIPTVFDGEDLGFVAGHWGVGVDEAVERIVRTGFRVAFCGFAPGFAYLSGLPGEVPRLAAPRARVPAGAVALAGRYAGVYPTASPGGWRVVGRTGLTLFDVRREPPAMLVPGARVRFVVAPFGQAP